MEPLSSSVWLPSSGSEKLYKKVQSSYSTHCCLPVYKLQPKSKTKKKTRGNQVRDSLTNQGLWGRLADQLNLPCMAYVNEQFFLFLSLCARKVGGHPPGPRAIRLLQDGHQQVLSVCDFRQRKGQCLSNSQKRIEMLVLLITTQNSVRIGQIKKMME